MQKDYNGLMMLVPAISLKLVKTMPGRLFLKNIVMVLSIPAGSNVTLTLKAKNVGDTTWHKATGFPVRLCTEPPV